MVFIMAGFHVPLMPLFELAGNDGAVLFWHNGPMAVKVGVVTLVLTVIVSVAVEAHCPAVGVNV